MSLHKWLKEKLSMPLCHICQTTRVSRKDLCTWFSVWDWIFYPDDKAHQGCDWLEICRTFYECWSRKSSDSVQSSDWDTFPTDYFTQKVWKPLELKGKHHPYHLWRNQKTDWNITWTYWMRDYLQGKGQDSPIKCRWRLGRWCQHLAGPCDSDLWGAPVAAYVPHCEQMFSCGFSE